MKTSIYSFLIILGLGCSQRETVPVPEHIKKLEHLTVYSSDVVPSVTVSFQKDVAYGGTDEILIGRMGEIAVDSLGRIFIADLGQMVIHVFESNGHYIKQLGRSGGGPGEFGSNIKNLQIRHEHLYVFDPIPRLLHLFSLEELAIIETVSLAENRSSYRELVRAFPNINNLYVRNDDTYIAEFIMHDRDARLYKNIEVNSLYYLLENNGSLSKDLLEFTSEIRTNLVLVINLKNFFGRALRGFSSDDQMYIVNPQEFLVKTYSPDGDYLSAFYYPFRKIPLTRKTAAQAGVSDRLLVLGEEISFMESIELPETWPVLTDMKIDNNDHLWIATTVEDMSIYEWWVLEENGELITRFEWPRDEPIEVVKNGYMYTRETEKETGLQHIVRYRIEMEEV